jgi:hypothetical protein
MMLLTLAAGATAATAAAAKSAGCAGLRRNRRGRRSRTATTTAAEVTRTRITAVGDPTGRKTSKRIAAAGAAIRAAGFDRVCIAAATATAAEPAGAAAGTRTVLVGSRATGAEHPATAAATTTAARLSELHIPGRRATDCAVEGKRTVADAHIARIDEERSTESGSGARATSAGRAGRRISAMRHAGIERDVRERHGRLMCFITDEEQPVQAIAGNRALRQAKADKVDVGNDRRQFTGQRGFAVDDFYRVPAVAGKVAADDREIRVGDLNRLVERAGPVDHDHAGVGRTHCRQRADDCGGEPGQAWESVWVHAFSPDIVCCTSTNAKRRARPSWTVSVGKDG